MAVASFVDTTTPKIREENLHSTQSHFDKSQCIVSYMNSLVKLYIKVLIKVHSWPKSLFSPKKTKKEDPITGQNNAAHPIHHPPGLGMPNGP